MPVRGPSVSDDVILSGVIRVLQQRGPGFSLADIGKHVGLTSARLVQRFGGRSGLIKAAFDYWGRKMIAVVETLAVADRPIRSYLQYLQATAVDLTPGQALDSIAWLQLTSTDSALRRWYREFDERYQRAMMRLLEAGIAKGELSHHDSAALAEQIAIVTWGIVARSTITGRGVVRQELTRRVEAELMPFVRAAKRSLAAAR